MKYIFILLTGIFLLPGCTGCSKSGKRNREINMHSLGTPKGKNVVKMKNNGGVYEIPVLINDSPMSFIFDTGAGLISISSVEASYLYKQGKLTKEDFLGEVNFMDANGDVSVGTIINLKKVTIGNKSIFNVHASVVHNNKAPLLLGQSALEQFGKISIDYKNGLITFVE